MTGPEGEQADFFFFQLSTKTLTTFLDVIIFTQNMAYITQHPNTI